MSSTPQPLPLDYDEQVARIRRAQFETDKFAEESRKYTEESRKLAEESRKLVAEERKLWVEADKLRRDRNLAPFGLLAGVLGGAVSGTVIALITHFLH